MLAPLHSGVQSTSKLVQSGSDGAKHVVSYEEDSQVHYEDSQAPGPASPEDDNCC